MDNKLNEFVKEVGMVPIESSSTTILLDINLLPQEYKNLGDLETTLKAYESRFDVKVIPVDTSRRNLEGNQPLIAQIVK